jgi:protocatechuate 3,4-dioxygenase alpha subunit
LKAELNTPPTASQTVGPFFHLGCTDCAAAGTLVTSETQGEQIRITCRVLDGDGIAVNDAMIEIWQANAEGKYNHPDDPQQKAIDPAFHGFGRLATDENGACTFATIKPGPLPGNGAMQAPHINVSVFARGVLKRLATRIYFAGDPALTSDPVLNLVPPERRNTLLAREERPGEWHFDICLCGPSETVFFNV